MHAAETVIRCSPYTVSPQDLVSGLTCDALDFSTVWNSLEAVRVIHVGLGLPREATTSKSLYEGLVSVLEACATFHVVESHPPAPHLCDMTLMGQALSGETVAGCISLDTSSGRGRFELRTESNAVADVLSDPFQDLAAGITGNRLKRCSSTALGGLGSHLHPAVASKAQQGDWESRWKVIRS